MRFSVCACDQDLHWRFPFPLRGSYEHCARLAAKIGYDAIELQIQDPIKYDGNKLKTCLDAYHMQVSSVTTGLAFTFEGMSMTDDDADARKKTVTRLKRQLDLAKVLDTKILLGIIRGRMKLGETKEDFEAKLTDSMWCLLEYAKEIGSGIIFEHINRNDGDIYNSTERTMQFIEKFQSPYLFYNIDTYHMITDDPSPTEALKRSWKKLELFHVSDEDRMLPDDKHFDFVEVADLLQRLNYQRWVTLECKPLPTSEVAARQGFDYLKRVFEKQV